MPLNPTITSFYSFVAGTPADADEMNHNLSIWKGHLIPFDPATIAASDLTHDLGKASKRWLKGYFANATINIPTASGYPLNYKVGGLQKFAVNETGFFGHRRNVGLTTTAGRDEIAASSGMPGLSTHFGGTISGTPTLVPGSTITVQTTGRPIGINIMPLIYGPTSLGSNFVEFNSGSLSSFVTASIRLYRDDSLACIWSFSYGGFYGVPTTNAKVNVMGGFFEYIDMDVVPGSYKYDLRIYFGLTGSTDYIAFNGQSLIGIEL